MVYNKRNHEEVMDVKQHRIRNILIEENPEAILVDGLDKALLGINRDNNPIGVYSYLKSIEALVEKGLSEEEALEQYHTQQKVAEIDENLPIWIDDTGV